MTATSERVISVERTIAAPAAEIFDVLARPARHAEIDGSDTIQSARLDGPDRLALDAKFGMKMKFLGIKYRITNTVVGFEENKLIAWQHFGRHVWRYELEPAGESTLVRESFDWRNTPVPKYYEVAGFSTSHLGNMARTLERLETVVTA